MTNISYSSFSICIVPKFIKIPIDHCVIICWWAITEIREEPHIQVRSQNLHHIYLGMGLQIGVFRSPPPIKITMLQQVTMYCSVVVNMNKTQHDMQRSRTHVVCICFRACGWQKPNTPNLSPMADDGLHYTGRYRRSEISLVYLWVQHPVSVFLSETKRSARKVSDLWRCLIS